jgi:hypothetical protein
MTDLQTAVEALERIEVLRVVEAGDGETASAALIVNRIMAVAREALAALQLTAQQTTVPIPKVEEIADHIDLWFRSGEDKPWSFLVEDLAGSIHSMLTARLKGGK